MIALPDQHSKKSEYRRLSRYTLIGISPLILASAVYWYIAYPKSYTYQIHLFKTPARIPSSQVKLAFEIPIRSYVELWINNEWSSGEDLPRGSYSKDITLYSRINRIELRATAVHAFHEFKSTDSETVTVDPEEPTPPTLSTPSDIISNGPLVIKGTVACDCSIEIIVNGTASGVITPDESGQFSWKINDLKPGVYRISAKAKAGSGSYSGLSQELSVQYIPFKRKLTALISLKKLQLKSDVVLPRDDERVARLTSGKTLFPDFIEDLFADIKINNYALRPLFLGVTPQINTDENLTTVQAWSNPNNQINLPALNGSVALDWPANFTENASVEISVQDYEVTSFHPLPYRSNGQQATWIGGREPTDGSSLIETGLRYRILHGTGDFLKFIRLDPYDTVPYPYTVIIDMAWGFLLIIPIIWAAWILRKATRHYEPLRRHFRLMTFFLGGLCFVTPITNLVLARTYLVNEPPTRIQLEFVYAELVILILVGLLPIGWVLSRDETKHSQTSLLRYLPFALLGRLLTSTILVFLIMSSLWLAIFRSEMDFSGYRFWPAIVGCLLLLAFMTVPVWLYLAQRQPKRESSLSSTRTSSGVTRNTSRTRLIGLLIGILMIVILGLLFHALIGDREDTFWDYNPSLSAPELFEFSLRKLTYAFGFLSPLSIYILFSGILLVLKMTEDLKEADKSLLLGFEKLLFVGVIVGTTEHLYMIPIPFMLSFLAYRLTMVNVGEHNSLDALTSEVFRRRKIKTIDSITELKFVKDSFDNLIKKFSNAEISPLIFMKRKSQLQSTIDRLEKENQMPLASSKTPLTKRTNKVSEKSQSTNYKVEDLVLGFGPHRSNWENGKHAAKYALMLALPFALVSAVVIVATQTWVLKRFLPLYVATQIVETFADRLILAFFFGYFFKYIKGRSGLKKGLYLTVAYTLCLLPLEIRDFGSSIPALIIYLAPDFIYLPLLGLVVFDRCTFQRIMREKYKWQRLVQFEDMPTLLAFTTVPATGLILSVVSLLTGEYSKIIPLLLKVALPEAPMVSPH